MSTLKLNEGDPIRINGAALPKGKMVKIQAQSTEFLQVSDPKAVYVPPYPRRSKLIFQPRVGSAVLLGIVKRRHHRNHLQ